MAYKALCSPLPVRWLALHCASEGCSGVPSRSSSRDDEPLIREHFVGIERCSVARLLRASELTSVWVPDESHQTTRDLARAQAAAAEALRVHRPQVSAFILKHGRTYARKKGWAMRRETT